MILHVFRVSLGLYSVLTFFAERASSFGISRDSSTLLLCIMVLVSTIARIGFGILVDKYRSSAVFGCCLGAYVTSLLVLVSTFVEDITFPMSICVATIGVATLVGPTTVGNSS